MPGTQEERVYEIRSDLGAVRTACAFVTGLARDAGFPAARVSDIESATGEAIANAIEHGNGGDPGLPVRIAVRELGDRLEIDIEDRGRGFDPAIADERTLARRLAGPRAGRLRGWGVFLIRRLADGYASVKGESRHILRLTFAKPVRKDPA